MMSKETMKHIIQKFYVMWINHNLVIMQDK